MRILQVIRSVDPRGGGPIEGLMQQGEQMRAAGHDVETVGLDASGTAHDPRLVDEKLHLIGPSRGRYGYCPALVPWLRRNLERFDIVVVHGLWQYHGYGVARTCKALGVPYVVFLHGMLDPWFSRVDRLKHLKKWLYWPWAEYRTLRDARYVLFTTAEELRLARETFWLYRARERLVGYGIQRRQLPPGSQKTAFLAKYPQLQGKRVLLYLSRLHPKKGCDLLIDAFADCAADHPDLHLVLAGPDDVGLRGALEAQVRQQGLEGRVSFPGMLTGAAKWGAYDAAEVFVLPSHQENFGIVVAEALASGLPVLTTHQVNIWREVAEAGAGFVEPDTLAGTRRMLQAWLDSPESAKGAMRLNAAACFERHFEIGQVVGELLRALDDAAFKPAAAHTFSGRLPGTAPTASQATRN